MKFKKWAASATAAVLLAAGVTVGGAAVAASATHPQVGGYAVCNTQTGNYDVTWEVSGDPGYPGVSWEFVSATRLADQIVGKTGTGGAGFTATETVTSKQTLHLEVGIQFSNHRDGDIVTNRGQIVISENCQAADAHDAFADIVVTPATCVANGSAAVSTSTKFATLRGTLDTTPGTHTAYFDADKGHTFYDTITGAKWRTQEVKYTVPAKDASLCPVLGECTTFESGGTATDLNANGWSFSETRSAGHNEFVPGALHVYTDDATTNAKAAGYHAASFALKDTGTFNLDWDGTTPAPGGQLLVDLDGNGSAEGFLVIEDAYGPNSAWLSSNWTGINLSAAPTAFNGGGTGKGGTINSWLQVFPNAQVQAVGYSLGSGIKGDGFIKSITAGCVTYTFDKVIPPTVPEPTIEWSYTQWQDGVYECNDTQVTITHEATKTTTTYKLVVVEGQYQVVVDQVIVDDPVTQTDTRQLDESERTTCVVALPPTFEEACGVANDKVTLPDVEGVSYSTTRSEDGLTVTVTATADEGYVLVPAEGDEAVVSEWTFEFTNEACPTPPTDTPKGGLAQTGAEIGTGVLAALVLLLAGGVFLIVRRRQNV